MNIKRLLVTTFIGSLVASSAFAQNNNTGEIVIQGVVPGEWEITVQDINSGYDFDLTDATADLEVRVGTIHVFTNATAAGGYDGHLFIESANAGRLINNGTIPGIAAEHQQYLLSLVINDLSAGNALAIDAASALPVDHDLVVPATIDFDGDTSGTPKENTYDVNIKLPGAQRPQASGVYTDTITITIMDDGDDA